MQEHPFALNGCFFVLCFYIHCSMSEASSACQNHHNQWKPIPCQHHSNHRCCNRRGEIARCIKSSLHARAPVRLEWVLLCSISTVQRVGQPVPFLRLPKPPQSMAARSMPTPQLLLQRLQRGNLLLHKIVTACTSTRSPGMGSALFYIHCSISDASNAVPEAAKATTINGSPFHANTTAITVAAIAEGKSPVA